MEKITKSLAKKIYEGVYGKGSWELVIPEFVINDISVFLTATLRDAVDYFEEYDYFTSKETTRETKNFRQDAKEDIEKMRSIYQTLQKRNTK